MNRPASQLSPTIGSGVQRCAPFRSCRGRVEAIADADRSCGRPQRGACRNGYHRRLQMKTKHLLGGVAVIAALALSAPAWAQPANPSGGNAVGVPGPNPGGPGLTPYSTGAPPSGRMPAGGRQTSEPTNIPSTPSASDTASATPPRCTITRAKVRMAGWRAIRNRLGAPPISLIKKNSPGCRRETLRCPRPLRPPGCRVILN